MTKELIVREHPTMVVSTAAVCRDTPIAST